MITLKSPIIFKVEQIQIPKQEIELSLKLFSFSTRLYLKDHRVGCYVLIVGKDWKTSHTPSTAFHASHLDFPFMSNIPGRPLYRQKGENTMNPFYHIVTKRIWLVHWVVWSSNSFYSQRIPKGFDWSDTITYMQGFSYGFNIYVYIYYCYDTWHHRLKTQMGLSRILSSSRIEFSDRTHMIMSVCGMCTYILLRSHKQILNLK